jgi:hypothetical protein
MQEDRAMAVMNCLLTLSCSDWVRDRLVPHAGNAVALRKELQMIAADLVETGWP